MNRGVELIYKRYLTKETNMATTIDNLNYLNITSFDSQVAANVVDDINRAYEAINEGDDAWDKLAYQGLVAIAMRNSSKAKAPFLVEVVNATDTVVIEEDKPLKRGSKEFLADEVRAIGSNISEFSFRRNETFTIFGPAALCVARVIEYPSA